MNDAGRAVSVPKISPTDAVTETACDSGKKVLSLSPEQLITACGLALMAIVVLAGSNYSLSIAKGDFKVDLRPAC